MDEFKLNCVIIDDEPAAIRILEGYCKKVSQVEVVCSFRNPLEAVSYLNKNKVDFILLDINMPQISGIELLHSLSNPPLAILTTAYSKFALESYDYDVVDYLLKPIRFTRFLRAINKISAKIILNHKANSQKSEKITLKDGKTTHTIRISDIVYLESLGNYIKIYTETKNIIVSSGLQDFIDKHKNISLCRVHKSYAINKEKITKINYLNVFLGSIKIPIGRVFRPDLKKVLCTKDSN